MTPVAILGAGSWGMVLAKHLGSKGVQTRLWARSHALARDIEERRENAAYLAGVVMPADVRVTSDLRQALEGAEVVVFVVPSHGLRELARACRSLVPAAAPIVSATKGIENATLMLMTEVLQEELGEGATER